MRRRRVLVIRRDDHKRDALGAVFLGAVADAAEIRARVERYLGGSIKVLDVDFRGGILRAEIEATAFEEESQNLVTLARSMVGKGQLRAATDTIAEAMQLDPLNADALRVDARARLLQGDEFGAESRWILAGEIAGFDAETLRGLAQVALQQDRRPTAMRYLEEATAADPDDAQARHLLEELRRQIELRFLGPGSGS